MANIRTFCANINLLDDAIECSRKIENTDGPVNFLIFLNAFFRIKFLFEMIRIFKFLRRFNYIYFDDILFNNYKYIFFRATTLYKKIMCFVETAVT